MMEIESHVLDFPGLYESLIENLYSLEEFVEKSNFHDAAIKDLATKIGDFAFKAAVDLKKQSSCQIHHSRDTYNHEEASQKQKLHQTLEELAKTTAELLNSINNNTSNESVEVNQTQPPITIQPHGSLSCSPKMVGSQNDVVTRIKGQLFSAYPFLLPISIIGMLGIGKTTLARTIFEDQSVTQHFEVKIWFTMPQKCNEFQIQRNLLSSIILALQHEIIERRTVTEMVQEFLSIKKPKNLPEVVQECLKGRRYLIVLDDIWSTQHWYHIKSCFPSDLNGSCILLTTRLYEVANKAWSSNDYHHVMSLLDPNESWDLFCNIFPLQEYRAPSIESFRSHLRNVVEKCDGLPQVIVTVAKRLSKCKNNIQHELKKIEKEIELLGILDSSAVTLIYNQLPEYLKACFLYLGNFPKRSEIQVKMLLRLWIAEGFVKPDEYFTLENVAYGYLRNLIDRSLVLISNRASDGKIKTCTVHSVMYNICFRKAQKEGILCAVNTQRLSKWSLKAFANSCRWCSLWNHSFDYYVLLKSNNPRSIFFFQENPKIFVSLKLLRVLAFVVPSPFLQREPMNLGDLVFLRYLYVTEWFEGLKDVMSTNLNLLTLVVSGGDSESQPEVVPTIRLPSTIWESPHLRHLELGALYRADPPSVVKENLQTLSWVDTSYCRRKKLYSSFPNIKKLKIFCKEDLEPNDTRGSCNQRIHLGKLDYLERLEMLTISAPVHCLVTDLVQPMFPLRLKKLRLSGTRVSWQELKVIGQLKCLEVLKLENVFYAKLWRVAEGGFEVLKFLLLKDEKLERWVASRDSFSRLECLVLRLCNSLEEIPNSVGEAVWLRSIELDRCSRPSLVASARDIEKRNNIYRKNLELKIKGQGHGRVVN